MRFTHTSARYGNASFLVALHPILHLHSTPRRNSRSGQRPTCDGPGGSKESTRWRAHGQGGQGVQHCSTIYTRDSWVNEKEKIAKGKTVIVRLSCWAHISPSSANNLFIHVHVPVDAINTAMFMNMHSDDERETLPQITRVISFSAALRVFHLLR